MFWIAVLAGHLFAIPSVIDHFRGVERFGDYGLPVLRALFLAGSAAFFLAKIKDVPCLRLRRGFRSKVSAALVIVFLHTEIFQQAQAQSAFPATGSMPARMATAFFFSTLILPVAARETRRWLRVFTQLLRRRFSGDIARWRRLCLSCSSDLALRLASQCAGVISTAPRAPPR